MTATASDDTGVVGVQFYIDGVTQGPMLTSAPYQTPWQTTNSANGTHVVRAIAHDAAGNYATNSATVTVANALPDTTPPIISGISASSVGTVSAVIAWTTDENSTGVVQYGTTTSYGASLADANLLQAHQVTLLNLNPGVLYHYRIQATDQSGKYVHLRRFYVPNFTAA